MLRSLILITATLILSPATKSAEPRAFNSLVAVVNGQVITESEVQQATSNTREIIIRSQPAGKERDKMLKSLRKNALESLVERELILSEFVKLGGTIKDTIIDQDIEKIIEREPFNGNRDKFIEDLRKTGMTMKKFRDMRQKIIAVEMMRSSQAKGISVVTPQKLTETYQKHKDKFREETFARIRTIMIPKAAKDPTIKIEDQRKLITEIRSKTMKGEDFAELAKEHSKDSVSDSGGDRGIIGEKSIKLRNDLKTAAFALDSGKVSEVLEDNYAFYLLKAENKKLGQSKSLNDPIVRDEVNKLALLELRKSAYERWITKLKKTASIRQFDSKGNLITKIQKASSE
ncbi:MAG: SurA N-terminal domain-containing protein [Verrucomicrobiales bacterium]|jgi:parvulin-like peptidyl-prolyl isomerase|nr:SurA N-terminal domain-containing protein [Verrucomicrobiales bacterium]